MVTYLNRNSGIKTLHPVSDPDHRNYNQKSHIALSLQKLEDPANNITVARTTFQNSGKDDLFVLFGFYQHLIVSFVGGRIVTLLYYYLSLSFLHDGVERK